MLFNDSLNRLVAEYYLGLLVDLITRNSQLAEAKAEFV